jgi:hypothetical protein
MLPLRLFRSRSFSAANTTAFLMIAALTAAAFLVSQYFQFARGVSPLGTGLRILPWTGTPLLVAPAAGTLSDRIGQRPSLAAGMLLQGVGLAWFALIATTNVGYTHLVGALLVAGVGISMALPTTPTAALSAVPPADRQGIRSQRHPATLRRRLRRRGRVGGLRRQQPAGHAGQLHRGVPPRAGRRRRLLPARCHQRAGGRWQAAGAGRCPTPASGGGDPPPLTPPTSPRGPGQEPAQRLGKCGLA